MKNSRDPQAMLNQIMSQNPQFKQMQNVINQYGGNPKNAFYGLAKQMGVDPEQVLSALR